MNSNIHRRRTKIVGTLGPASVPRIRELIIAGINVFRLNFSHIKVPNSQDDIIKTIRDHSADLGIPVAILGDLGGPKIRCNAFDQPSIALPTGGAVELISAPKSNPDYLGKDGMIISPVPGLVDQLDVGHRVLLDDGYIILTVSAKKEFELGGEIVSGAICTIVQGGVLKPKKGINVPDLKIKISALTEKDKSDAKYIFEKRLDYVALSFVQKPQDVQDLLDLFEQLQLEKVDSAWRPWIISKIEKPQALDDIDEIIRITDGIMVARGDLGVEVNYDRVPVIQKMLIAKCNAAEIPVITATQMLESMIHSPTPTRAEVSDVANAVFDGTDAVMLSAECAVGDFPIEAVRMMGTICKTAEKNLQFAIHADPVILKEMIQFRKQVSSRYAHSIAEAAVQCAVQVSAKAIIAFTTSSETPIYVSKCRPTMPVFAITTNQESYQKLALFYGVYPFLSTSLKMKGMHGKSDSSLNQNTDTVLAQSERDIMDQSERQRKSNAVELTSTAGPFLEVGDVVVFCAGLHPDFPGLSSSIKISEFGNALRSIDAKRRWTKAIKNI
jgi:pyruvate kinase